jgi:hypothetical protein
MTILDELGDALSEPTVALEIIETLGADNVQITEVTTVRSGNSGARLAKVTLADLSDEPNDRPCVIKYCPPDLASRRPEDPREKRPESARHKQALQESPPEFRERHLVESVFMPIRCGGGAFVMGLSGVDGVPLGTVELGKLAGVCKQVWEETLHEWTKHAFARRQSTVADLLRWELGDSNQARTWMHDWAEERGLLTPALLRLPDESDPLPNPWRILDANVPEARAKIHYLAGRTHGDLHGDNVLVPMFNDDVYANEFRLIDMATYHPKGPLSRDPAALLVSLCSREIGVSSPSVREASLAYLEHKRRAEHLYGSIPPEIRNVIDALREPTREFAKAAGWEADWHQQLKVSLQDPARAGGPAGGPDGGLRRRKESRGPHDDRDRDGECGDAAPAGEGRIGLRRPGGTAQSPSRGPGGSGHVRHRGQRPARDRQDRAGARGARRPGLGRSGR